VIYLESGGSSDLTINNPGTYTVQWFDPRNGGSLKNGSVTGISGTGSKSLGNPPGNASSDWVVYVKNSQISTLNATLSNQLINIYPNPAKGELYIQHSLDELYFQIISPSGKLIKSGNPTNNFIYIDNLESGVYFLKLVTADGYTFKRFIKQ
ncbi:MAG: T9SS type A sorting domain-containing protein, partial [Bacteroidales bacterium]|nr:T9SS type A sorting domain-containing protein [Bacteroidales bacterium]